MSTDYLIPSLSHGLRLLMILAESDQPLTLAELCKRTQISKTTAFRCLQTFMHFDLVEKAESDSAYKVGLGVLKLGFWQLAKMDLAECGQKMLDQLRDATGYSAHIAIREHRDVIYIARAISKMRVVASGIGPGARLPVYNTGVGRMLIAYLSRNEFETLYPEHQIQEGNYPQRDREDLWTLLQQDKAKGFVISESFFEQGISSIVYPVGDMPHIKAVVTLTIPADRVDEDKKVFLQTAVKKTALTLSERLSFHC